MSITEPKKRAPDGSWPSEVSATLLTRGQKALGAPQADGSVLYWLESRPSEGGRSVVVRKAPGEEPIDYVPAGVNVRTRVHEYGGISYTVRGGLLVYVDFTDQQLHLTRDGDAVSELTNAPGVRFAAPQFTADGSALVAVAEDHTRVGEPANRLVHVGLQNGVVTTLAEGADFYGVPALRDDGTAAWVEWDHPNMPWDTTRLMIATMATGVPDSRPPRSDDGESQGAHGKQPAPVLAEVRQVPAAPDSSSVYPSWAPDGTLLFLNDADDFWQPYRFTLNNDQLTRISDFGADFCFPPWLLGGAPFCVVDEWLFAPVMIRGESHCARVELATGTTRVEFPILTTSGITRYADGIVYVGGDRTQAPALIYRSQADAPTVVRKTTTLAVDPNNVSVAQPLEFPTTDGHVAYGLFYPPVNAAYEGREEELPPLLVSCHGGPTGHVQGALNVAFQYWTSRGFAVLDVNYRGSSGYGRRYRNLLKGKWGIYDVEDSIAGARYLVEQGRVDGARVAIRGGSAGGFTTLAALAFRDFFKAGISYFGVSDLEALARETHKFESRYMDGLIGPYPEAAAVYRERSPINFTEGLSAPMILFQGEDDKVVPPNQAELMAESLREKGVPVALVLYPGEGHGFRREENIIHAAESSLAFLGRVFGFTPADELPEVEMENL